MAAVRAYHPKRTFAGPTIVIRSEVPPAGVTLDDLGWSKYVTGPVTVVDVPGDHLSMIRPPHVATLASRLAPAIEGVA
jgi:thioesterase domain-containing protein